MSHRAVNPRQFGDYTLSYHPPEMGVNVHTIRAEHEGQAVGAMVWTRKSHEIHNVHVQPDHQRKGLATAMWNMGQELRPKPKHSPDRTESGDAWARKVGGRIPRGY